MEVSLTRRFWALGQTALIALTLAHPVAAADNSPAALKTRFEALWNRLTGKDTMPGIATSNGRIEAQQILVSAKLAGRLAEVFAEEGKIVDANAVLARMDTADLEAEMAGARAQLRRSTTAEVEAEAAIAQRKSELVLASQEYDRARTMSEKGSGTVQQRDMRASQLQVAEAALRAANASREEAAASSEAEEAEIARIQSQLDDTVLKAPTRGRIEYKLVQKGEVVSAGAPIATMLDLSDVSMTIFVPARVAAELAIGDEARIILDAAPQYVMPASVSFVASEAQFTPKTVETADEREKLMFRVKLKVAPELLKDYESRVKTGIRGIGYVRTQAGTAWPDALQTKLPQ
jgi:HlyD family secretion protein